tara:strand:+ start:74 stop:844 length:771 start_codon:yes stop_codon:yes gene_type:complete
MKALLLAAGVGTRLKPYTDFWPKCLMPINKIPLLEYWIYDLINVGVKNIYINTHHCSEEVVSFIKNNKYKDQIITFYEKNLLGTAGTIKSLNNELKKDKCIVVHADNFCNCNLDQYVNSHADRPKKTEITMMTFKTNKPENCGIVELDDSGIVTSFTEKSKEANGNIANAAIYILEPSVIEWIFLQDKVHNISVDVINEFVGKINTWHNSDMLVDIGTYESLYSCQKYNHRLKKSEQNKEWLDYYKNLNIYNVFNF